MADSCQCMTKPTAMLWSDYLPTNKNKWKKKKENTLENTNSSTSRITSLSLMLLFLK